MNKLLIFFFAAIVSFIGFLIVLAPAAPIWAVVGEDFVDRIPELKVHRVNGTIWKGDLSIRYRQFPNSDMSWQMRPIRLLALVADLRLNLTGNHHNFSADTEIERTGIKLTNLSGTLNGAYINTISQPQGLMFSGEFKLSDISITSDMKWIQSAQGTISWPGGRVISRNESSTQIFELPALQGDLGMKGDSVQLLIHSDRLAVIDIRLKPNGWIIVIVKARLFDLASLSLPEGSDPEDSVLEFEERIFQSSQ